jgi:hypothetical protein
MSTPRQPSDACVIQHQSFGGGSVMVWGGITAHGRTPFVVVAGNLTGMRYHVSLAARCLGSKIGWIAGRLGLMLCSRSLLRTVLELIGRNPGMIPISPRQQ